MTVAVAAALRGFSTAAAAVVEVEGRMRYCLSNGLNVWELVSVSL